MDPTKYILAKKNQKQNLENIKQKMIDCCQHNFVKDEIDISPEKSQQIEYCSICDFTK